MPPACLRYISAPRDDRGVESPTGSYWNRLLESHVPGRHYYLAETSCSDVRPGIMFEEELRRMPFPVVNVRLPDWTKRYWSETSDFFPSVEDRMRFVVELSRQNTNRHTGGPFGAAVFDHEGRLIAPGINMVVPSNCSILHAEIVALALAQNVLGRYDIGDAGKLEFDLVTSTEPCAMCFGAVHWSGVSRLICGARDKDARSVGFDEGPKVRNWVSELRARGITVLRDVLREDAAAVLREYAAEGLIYNAGQHGRS